jgi:hydroxyacylglutathione hydrolase
VFFRQYLLGCLSQLSYLVGDETSGRAVVVDPHRDVSVYLDDAADRGLRIERVIETHCHADFLSGHLELAAAGAVICYGEGVRAEFAAEYLTDGRRLDLGEVRLEIRATPGHTPESISVVVYEHPGDPVPYGVLTGDALFIGDVGRPDLLSASGLTPATMAAQLYRSLWGKLLTLPEGTRVFPAHGAGSACGKNLSTNNSSTIGEQRRTNYALALPTGEAFVAAVTEGQPVTPPYFTFAARRNLQTRPLLDEHRPPPPLSLPELRAQQRRGAVVLDTREPGEFAGGHLRGSVNVGLGGRFAEWAGDVVRPDQPVALVCRPGRALEATVRLARIGFDQVIGRLDDPLRVFREHPEAVVRSSRLTAAELAARQPEIADLVVIDVRNPGERERGVIPGAVQLPLPRLLARLGELDPARPTVVYCASGYRSMIAAGVLAAAGFGDVSDLLGGYEAWAALTPDALPERAAVAGGAGIDPATASP